MRKIRLAPIYFVLIIFAIIFMFPLYWAIVSSFKMSGEIFTNPWGLPNKPVLDNYIKSWTLGGFFRAYINSGILTVSTVAIIVILSSMVAYPLSRYNFRGRNGLFYFIVAGYMIPPIAILIPLYFMLKSMNLIDSLLGILLAYVGLNLPIPVFIMRSYMSTIPREIDESAYIDGASPWYVFWRIILPLSKPAVATVAIWTGLITWQDFLYALTILLSPENFTVPRAILNFYGMYATIWGYIAAAFIFAILPMQIFYLIFQRQFVRGLTAGAVRG
ncbi:MAG: carbohydrate ABC transporter permease [Candidatus Korarchaeota archaeon]|nr:carbohydrate ABC transporter permease [Thermoproteota archaeon]